MALYFVISGFLSYPSVARSKSFRDYLKKKETRILPMYYVSLLLTFIVGGIILKEYPISWQWIYHVFFLNMFVPAKEWMWWNSVNFFWTMPAFVAWYVISYPLLRRIDNAKKAALATLILVVAVLPLKRTMLLWASEKFVNWNFFCLIYVFMFGVLAYFIVKEKRYLTGVIYSIGIGIAGIAVGNRSGFFAFGLVFYLLIVFLSSTSIKWSNSGTNKLIKSLSDITYSTYLTHWFVLKLVGGFLNKVPWQLAYILFVTTSAVLGYICYRFIENPFAKYFRTLGSGSASS